MFLAEQFSDWVLLLDGSLLEEVSGCSTQLVRTLVGGSSALPSALPSSSLTTKSQLLDNSNKLLLPKVEDSEEDFTQTLVTIIYEYLSVGKPQAISNWLSALQGLRRVSVLSQKTGLLLWQVKLISRAAHFLHCLTFTSDMNSQQPSEKNTAFLQPSPLISAEQALSLCKRLQLITDTWYKEVHEEVIRYLSGDTEKQYSAKCAFTLVMQNLSYPIPVRGNRDFSDPLSLLSALRKAKVPAATIPGLVRAFYC
ncbi:hypothetical protein SK128_009963 [Halocaridina rubra]|uniref:Anaphase-promoting complex subunit 1 C-terminal domain-containing protein n=1 Tax=Halocaridina rubra TaxID=373956 RepID=A0AAN8WQH2_HALRR